MAWLDMLLLVKSLPRAGLPLLAALILVTCICLRCCMDGHGLFGQLVATLAVQNLPHLGKAHNIMSSGSHGPMDEYAKLRPLSDAR